MKLISIPNYIKYLKKDVTPESLKQIASCISDNDCAVLMQDRKEKLFTKIGLDPLGF
jgi:hypothetical protein